MFFSALAVILAGVVGCDKENGPEKDVAPTPVESVVITPALCEVLVGEEIKLSEAVYPEDAEYTIEWLSTNNDVATVLDGTVYGVAIPIMMFYWTGPLCCCITRCIVLHKYVGKLHKLRDLFGVNLFLTIFVLAKIAMSQ